LREPEGLLHSLQRVGIRPDEVDAVITTHLHIGWEFAPMRWMPSSRRICTGTTPAG
jgi:hypothetical protein